jgi:hypothetical protein
MAKTIRTKKQVLADKRALTKLRDTGLFTGKIDLRKAPSRSARKAMARYADVLSGKSAYIKTPRAKEYAAAFETARGGVIVPKRKGERIGIAKSGKITRSRKIGSRTVKMTIRVPRKGELQEPTPRERVKLADTMFRVPFRRGSGPGQEVVYRTFDYKTLLDFFGSYLKSIDQFDEWAGYIEEIPPQDGRAKRKLRRDLRAGGLENEE